MAYVAADGTSTADNVAEQRRIARACSSLIMIVTNAPQALQKILIVLSEIRRCASPGS